MSAAGAALDAAPEVGLKHERLDGSDLETTKAAHEALLSAYACVVDDLSLVQSARELMEHLPHEPTVVIDRPFPPLVRYMVESHLRRQLRELGKLYTRLRHGRTPQALATEPGRAWLREAAEDTARFAGALPRRGWLWELMLSAATLVPASVLAWGFRPFGEMNARQVLLALAIVAPIALAVVVAHMMLQSSFEAKRRLFGAPAVRRRRDSVYEREDTLFELLGRPKLKELPLDSIVSLGMTVLATVVAAVSALIAFRMRYSIGGLFWAAVAAGLLGTTVRSARKARHRLPPY